MCDSYCSCEAYRGALSLAVAPSDASKDQMVVCMTHWRTQAYCTSARHSHHGAALPPPMSVEVYDDTVRRTDHPLDDQTVGRIGDKTHRAISEHGVDATRMESERFVVRTAVVD